MYKEMTGRNWKAHSIVMLGLTDLRSCEDKSIFDV